MKLEVKSGQIYREKDKRFVRHVVVVQILTAPMKKDRAECAPCREDGTRMYGGRISKIKTENLQRRFELIGTR